MIQRSKPKRILWTPPPDLAALPSGTPVIVTLDNGGEWHTKTRSEPWQLGHGDWVVLLEGKSGGWALERVRAKA